MRRDKYAMAAAVERAGVPSLISRRVKNPDEALAAAREINSWPVVIKPLEGAGSLGVSICGSMDELRERCARLLLSEDLFGQPCREALVQEYAAGTEYIVNTVSCGGRHYLTDMWRYRKIKIADRGNAYDHALLVSEPTAEERELFEYVKSCLDALGFEYGPSHTEAMITPKGPRLIEAGARPMGSILDIDVFHEATGHRIVDLALDSALEPEKLRAHGKALRHAQIADDYVPAQQGKHGERRERAAEKHTEIRRDGARSRPLALREQTRAARDDRPRLAPGRALPLRRRKKPAPRLRGAAEA
ncbi:ATP-grasp domain-containing protein [uncultured Cloacibacillus sp.]|uniref:ATP-grasp domain-containing protein n=1 Tax=uncultured Cloacibacillus sp. TaxID=889794 RepID=UPI0026DC30B4|nr:ATP-grasp domain-containing protein [uncultured Cloacibacillus sp.]